MNAPVTRRALLGASTAVIGAVGLPARPTATLSAATAAAGWETLSVSDARLVALADAYDDVELRCAGHTAAVRGLVDEDEAGFHEIARHFLPIEEEMMATPADTMVGVVAKARFCRTRTARESAELEMFLSLADDVWRVLGAGAPSRVPRTAVPDQGARREVASLQVTG